MFDKVLPMVVCLHEVSSFLRGGSCVFPVFYIPCPPISVNPQNRIPEGAVVSSTDYHNSQSNALELERTDKV